MKKLLLFLTAVFFTAISANVFAQGVQQTTTINSVRNYWVNSAAYATAPTGDAATNTYSWSVYSWDGTADYTLDAWTGAAAVSGTDYSGGADTDYNTQITWLAAGDYVVEVVETSSDNCTTVRRFGISVIDLDLLVVTKDDDGATLSDSSVTCNTNSGDAWGDSHADDLNSETLETMTMTYEISLYTVKGSSDTDDLIGTALPAAEWKFSVQDNSTIPTAGDVTWTVTGGTGSYSTGALNEITVAAGTSTVTITAEIDNIAGASTEDYVLDFSIATTTVLVENGGSSATDYAEGEEPADYDGATDAASHTNSAYKIRVNPIPNTTKIKFD